MEETKKSITEYLRYISLEDAFEWSGDWTAAILHDEFHKKQPRFGGDKKDYRERGIDRLIKIGAAWGGHNENISYNVNRRYMKIKCPYCGELMTWYGATGTMYKCECGAVANPSGSINFDPPKKQPARE